MLNVVGGGSREEPTALTAYVTGTPDPPMKMKMEHMMNMAVPFSDAHVNDRYMQAIYVCMYR